MRFEIAVYDAFTEKPGMGNPAGIVADANGLTAAEMQRIAAALGFNESLFILRDGAGRLTYRYFTPGQEVPMCGHATIAGTVALAEEGRIGEGLLTIGTGSGELLITVTGGERFSVSMRQLPYREMPFSGSRAELARVLGIEEDRLDSRFPVCYASTGLWTLLVPVKTLADMARMRPLNQSFPAVLKENERSSVHPFCLETRRPDCVLHGRHFSSPFSGTVEDAVTGTACGAMGGYYSRYICPSARGQVLNIEQGHEIGRDGLVTVAVPADPEGPLTISGTAVFTRRQTVTV